MGSYFFGNILFYDINGVVIFKLSNFSNNPFLQHDYICEKEKKGEKKYFVLNYFILKEELISYSHSVKTDI